MVLQCNAGEEVAAFFYMGPDYGSSQGPFVFPGISVQGSLRLHGFRVGAV